MLFLFLFFIKRGLMNKTVQNKKKGAVTILLKQDPHIIAYFIYHTMLNKIITWCKQEVD